MIRRRRAVPKAAQATPSGRVSDPAATSLMRDLARYIDRHAAEELPLRRLAVEAQMSPTHLQRRFKRVLGVTPKAYQDAARLRLLKSGLKSGARVLDSITAAGFQSTSRVYGHATRTLGMTLSAYRAGGSGETIAYACRDTALGPLLMAATGRGVCFAEFGRGEAALLGALRQEYPRATLVRSAAGAAASLDAWLDALGAHLAGAAPCPDLPLDLRGTAFQIRVWRFLLGVPAGTVRSYADVARGIGAPSAVRAAAGACGANRVAVLIPCHRVLRGDGGLGGYRWGVGRKRALLTREGATLSARSRRR